jgi:hypothetical protein
MLSIDQHFGKHCIFHLHGECVVGRVVEALYRAGRRWRVRFNGADWWSRGVGRCRVGLEHLGNLFMDTW